MTSANFAGCHAGRCDRELPYGSVYFVIKALAARPSSFVFPVFAVGVVGVSALGAVLLFKEKLTAVQLAGMLLGLVALLLL